MFRPFVKTFLATAAFALLAPAAYAANGVTAQGAQMYAGPSEAYPHVDHLAGGLSVEIHGCLQNGGWCDVSWRGRRGWMAANTLNCTASGERLPLSAGVARVNVPVVGFEFNSYWDTNYRKQLWYEDRAKWAAGVPVQNASADSDSSSTLASQMADSSSRPRQ